MKRAKTEDEVAAGRLPVTLFANMENDGEGEYYPISNTTINMIESGAIIGVYTLNHVARVVVGHSLEEV